MEIGEAVPDDAATLTEIAFEAKRHWGYPEAWMEQWRTVLTITSDDLAGQACFVAKDQGRTVGFVSLRREDRDLWIDHLWVLPDAMGRGIGRALFSRAIEAARRFGFDRLLVESDPQAEGFYARMGARTIKRHPAPIEGVERFLPVMAADVG